MVKPTNSTKQFEELLVLGNYDARYRVLLRHMATLLGVVWEEFEDVSDFCSSTYVVVMIPRNVNFFSGGRFPSGHDNRRGFRGVQVGSPDSSKFH